MAKQDDFDEGLLHGQTAVLVVASVMRHGDVIAGARIVDDKSAELQERLIAGRSQEYSDGFSKGIEAFFHIYNEVSLLLGDGPKSGLRLFIASE